MRVFVICASPESVSRFWRGTDNDSTSLVRLVTIVNGNGIAAAVSRAMRLLSRDVSDEQSEVIASRVGEHRPPAHMRDFRFGQHRFPSVRFDGGKPGVDVVSRKVD